MPSRENKRQKKLAKINQKQKRERQKLARQRNALASISGQVAAAAKQPWISCHIDRGLLEQLRESGDCEERFGTIVINGRVQGKGILAIRFLIDGLCLGVKECVGNLFDSETNAMVNDQLSQHEDYIDCTRELAWEILMQARDFAAGLGFSPGGRFTTLLRIFGPDFDENAPQDFKEKFHFGCNADGRPRYVASVRDSPDRQREILTTLTERVGADHFDFVDVSTDDHDWDSGSLPTLEGLEADADELDEELGPPMIQLDDA